MVKTRQRMTTAEARQYWQAHNDGYRRSGQSQAAYCKQHKLNIHTFTYWRHRLNNDQDTIKLVQVPTQASQAAAALRVEVNGYGIEVSEGFSPASLAAVVRVLREL